MLPGKRRKAQSQLTGAKCSINTDITCQLIYTFIRVAVECSYQIFLGMKPNCKISFSFKTRKDVQTKKQVTCFEISSKWLIVILQQRRSCQYPKSQSVIPFTRSGLSSVKWTSEIEVGIYFAIRHI